MDAILRKIVVAPTLPFIWRHLSAYFRRQGFGMSGYHLLRAGSYQPASVPLHSGLTRAQFTTYLSFAFQRLDIAPRAALAAGVPVRWSDVWGNAQVTPEEREMLDALRAVDFPDGYSMPCYGPQGRNGVVSIGKMSAETDVSPTQLSLLHFLAQAAHLRTCHLFAAEGRCDRQLSRREKEILDWVARGKSNGVIAEILEISSGTVDTYMRRIYEKLDVSDRTSAAVKGVGLGLITA